MKRYQFFIINSILLLMGSFALAQPGGGGGRGGPGPSSPGGSFPGGNGGGFGQPSRPNPPPPPPSSSSCGTSESRNSTQSFNGMRIASIHDPFQVVLIEVLDNSIRVSFNIPINPSSFNKKNILINEVPLDKTATIKFNKTGKILEIKTKTKLHADEEFVLEFTGVKSFDNEKLTLTKFNSLHAGSIKEYPSIKSDKIGEA